MPINPDDHHTWTLEQLLEHGPGAELETWQDARKAALNTADALTAELEEFAR